MAGEEDVSNAWPKFSTFRSSPSRAVDESRMGMGDLKISQGELSAHPPSYGLEESVVASTEGCSCETVHRESLQDTNEEPSRA